MKFAVFEEIDEEKGKDKNILSGKENAETKIFKLSNSKGLIRLVQRAAGNKALTWVSVFLAFSSSSLSYSSCSMSCFFSSMKELSW
jgi:hypothetical protein